MSKTFSLTSVLLLVFLLFATQGRCFADAAELFEQAGIFTDNGYRQQAEELYKRIVTDYPGTNYALKAQGELIGLSMPTKEGAQIQADIDGLIANYSGYADLPAVLCDIAASYGWSVEFERANGLYQQVIQQYPGSSAARKAELGISRINAVSLIGAGDYTAAAVKVNKMLTDFSGHPYLPAALYHIAKKYEWSRKYAEARSTYQQIIQQYSDSAQAKAANLDVAKIDILLLLKAGDFDTAGAKVDKLLEDSSGNLGLAEVLRKIAREYEVQLRYTEAGNTHQQIIQRYPDSPQGGLSRLDLPRTKVLSLIESGDYTAASAEFARLVQDNSGNPELPSAIYAIAKKYDRLLNYEQAKITYSQVIEQYPTSSVVNDAQWGFSKTNVLSLIKSGDSAAAASAFDKLVQDFSGHSELPAALCDIAREYEWSYEYGQAKNAYQRIIQQYPGSAQMDKARLGFPRANILSLIEARQEAAAQTAVDSLIADFNGHPELPATVILTGLRCYNRASQLEKDNLFDQSRYYFRKVVEIWQTITQRFAASVITPESCCWAGDSYRKLGEYGKSTECFQRVVDNHAGYKHIWHALFTMGLNYESLKEAGAISQSQADLKIKAAYQQVLENYPGCPAAEYVQSWMANNL